MEEDIESEGEDGKDIMDAHDEYIKSVVGVLAWEFEASNANVFLQSKLSVPDIKVIGIDQLYYVLEASGKSLLSFRGYIRFAHPRTLQSINEILEFGSTTLWRPIGDVLKKAMFLTRRLIDGPWNYSEASEDQLWNNIFDAVGEQIVRVYDTESDTLSDTDLETDEPFDPIVDDDYFDPDYDDEESFPF